LTDRVKNEVLQAGKKEKNILLTIKLRNWSQLAWKLPSKTHY